MHQPIRRIASILVALALFSVSPPSHAQSVPPIDRRITYILPHWDRIRAASYAEVAQQVEQLRSRIGEGPRVRVGFTAYAYISVGAVDPSDSLAMREALAPTFAEIDAVIAKAAANGIPVCFSFVSAIRGTYDGAQLAAESEDIRSMQWYSDNSLAGGWATYSRYARTPRVLQEAFFRELGRGLAARMAANPGIVVAASGDAEVEMSNERSSIAHPETSLIADYSPFAVAEFRDWLRHGGLYGPGQPFAGQGWTAGGRYAGDASPAQDTNGDGHTLNGDFGTSFSSWDLKHFDWSLGDATTNDPHAIPLASYSAPGWVRLPAQFAGGFDPPRVHQRGNPWSDLWDEFRATTIWRQNQDIARWVTTSADPATGATVPGDRWFSDQIPADYLWGTTPANPDYYLDFSASPLRTADTSPYGSLGITSFNVNYGSGLFGRTLAGAAPEIAARRVRWGILEWNPSVAASSDLDIYRREMALVLQYRPAILVPFQWSDPVYAVQNSGFEVTLRELVQQLNTIPLTLDRATLPVGAVSDGSARTPPQIVRVSGAPGETPAWAITAPTFLDVVIAPDRRSFTVAMKPQAAAPGVLTGTIVVSPAEPGYTAATLEVNVTVTPAGANGAPHGSFDSPIDNAIVSGEVAVTGWAVDDLGVSGVSLYRAPLPGEPVQPNGLVNLGTATLVRGARPDVQAAYPNSPLSEQAGWGYMLLTNMLPNRGNGVFTVYAFASDVEGHTAYIGQRRIDCRNQSATIPFGTIDTPGQGATVSGTIVNFGWALTPQPSMIPLDGSTIDVVIDGAIVGHPVYNQFRGDIAALFPGYVNTDGAIGYFMIDTTTLVNGVHTIAWIVRDTGGGAAGMGSRYFTVANP